MSEAGGLPRFVSLSEAFWRRMTVGHQKESVMGEPRACPDCQVELHRIKLIDRHASGEHVQARYTAGDAKRGMFLGRYPIEGKVEALMCSSCGRIVLYGEPS